MKPILSVITPVYNGEKFIARCYNNLLLQTFREWEWVVVNDGSTDGTASAVEAIADDRINLFSYDLNKGRGYARTQCLAQACGEWVVVWDVDDMYFPDRLKEIERARLDGYDFFCSYAVLVDNRLNIKGVRGFVRPAHGLPRGFVHPTMACRTELAREIGYCSDIRTGEDAKILWLLSMKHRGLWFKDALAIYQEDREVNLWKAIDSSLGHLSQLKEMCRNGAMGGFKNRQRLYMRYLCKLAILNLMRLCPSLYMKLVPLRSAGEIKPNWTLSKERINFIKNITAV
jgi:glycosyltransferase involved in cell wall biosynthesis